MAIDEKTGRRVPPFDREDHKWMILNQDAWPQWPRLPVKRTSAEPMFGIIPGTGLASDYEDGAPIKVLTGVMFLPPEGEIAYETVDALLDDGWEVD